MAAKKYFQDRIVLLLLSVNVFLALLTSALVILRLDPGSGVGQIVQYRSNLGLNAFKAGSTIDFISFIVFAVTVTIFHTYLSMKVYHIRRHFATAILGLGSLLLVLTLIVSNALIIL